MSKIKPAGSYSEHQDLIKAFTIAAHFHFPDIIIIPYFAGMVRDYGTASRIMRVGLKGVPDLIVDSPKANFYLDAKTGGAEFSKDQRAFRDRLRVIKGKDVVFSFKSVEEGLEICKNMIK